MRTRTTWLILACLSGLASLPSCAVVKATQQPEKKNLAVLRPGVSRSHLIAELGAPVFSEERDGATTDIFAFKQGYSRGAKAGRALVHGAADVATMGLWEVVGVPAEILASGSEIKLEVRYDDHRNIESIKYIEGERVATAQPWYSVAKRPARDAVPAAAAASAPNPSRPSASQAALPAEKRAAARPY